jgi:hypothetical protein
MAIFTIFFEYRGGTYIRQVSASNETLAFQNWSKEIAPGDIKYFGQKMKEKAILDACNPDFSPVLLEKSNNVWCTTCASGLLHIVKTVSKG